MNRVDNFSRANDTLAIGTPSDGGSAWVAEMPGDNWGIFANTAYHSGAVAPTIATLEASVSDVDVEVTITAAFGAFGLAFRASDASNYLILYINSSLQALVKVVGGSTTNLNIYSGAMTAGDVFRVRASGSSLTSYQNGVLRASATETHNQTATRHGLYNEGGSASGVQYDAFSITGLGGGGPTIFARRYRSLRSGSRGVA